MEDFKTKLPIDDAKYDLLMSTNGLDGYKFQNGMSGNVTLVKGDQKIRTLNSDTKSELIKELNAFKGGNRRTHRHQKNKKSRKNRRKSYHRRR
jgi:hypothetical protein